MIFGSIVAPTSLATALLYYFGLSYERWYFAYFGVDSTVVGLGTVDYLIQSVEVLFVPLTLAALAGLFALWARSTIRWHIDRERHPRTLRAVISAMVVLGFVLTVVGILGALQIIRPGESGLLLWGPPLGLVLGVPLFAYAGRLLRPRPAAGAPDMAGVAEWAIVFTLVAIGLFWAAGNYATEVGYSQARYFADGMAHHPAVVVYSQNSLSLSTVGVAESRCQNERAAYRFRYDGLKLLLRSADQYVLLPAKWDPSYAVSIVLPRTDAVRLEFVPVSASVVITSRQC